MRWFWIDKFKSFERGRCATAVKAVSISEEHMQGYFPGYPVMTPTFVIEGFAQMGGIVHSMLEFGVAKVGGWACACFEP